MQDYQLHSTDIHKIAQLNSMNGTEETSSKFPGIESRWCNAWKQENIKLPVTNLVTFLNICLG